MEAAAIRQAFLKYFEQHHHTMVSSSSLVPDDSTLLFTNAGMVQFKDTFLGIEGRDYTRACSSQRCVRAGGKHNDLENVGATTRHHTFFEMLGNFSFGDYFKQEAIKFAWDFLTKELAIPVEKLWVTVFKDDDEAASIWQDTIGVSPVRIIRCGEKDNFWSMGDTGPCGPCTEIFYDHGEHVPGGPPGSPDEDGDRYIEIWNLVFMQSSRAEDGSLTPLPKPSVDTGMGLERIAAVKQGTHDNFDTDLFKPLIDFVLQLSGMTDPKVKAPRVIADHIRSSAFLILDGVVPGNEGRGYVLRRIIRRACRYGHKLNLQEAFFYRLVEPLVTLMGDFYEALKLEQERIKLVIREEEEQFNRTLSHGLEIFEQELSKLETKVIPGDVAFRLYDTYGFPLDLTKDMAGERGLQVDEDAYQLALEAQRALSRQGSQFAVDYSSVSHIDGESTFCGYESLVAESDVIGLIKLGESVESLAQSDKGVIALNDTPFYAESGGQVGDIGLIESGDNLFEVHDTQRQGDVVMHYGVVKQGQFSKGMKVTATVDEPAREAIKRNHSSTHLLNAALTEILGAHTLQKGSLVLADRLRFDFSHNKSLTDAEVQRIEDLVNQKIQENALVQTEVMTVEQAKQSGAVALFGEKYDGSVRVLTMGAFSKELCGGTHVSRTGNIGVFKIVSEAAVASGVRRIEAVTGQGALAMLAEQDATLRTLSELLKAPASELVARLRQQQTKLRELEQQNKALQKKIVASSSEDLFERCEVIGDVKLLATKLDGESAASLRDRLDQLKSRSGDKGDGVFVLASVDENNKVVLIAGVTAALSKTVKAGELVNHVATQVGGKGGGRPDMAQAGGSEPEKLDAALVSVRKWLESKLKN